MRSLTLASTSRADDAGYLALCDLTAVIGSMSADYRLVGGLSVTLLAHVYEVTGIPIRETADADLGADFSVVGDQRLINELTQLGYERPDSSNRFVRDVGGGMRAVIDVLAPSTTGRYRPNREHGAIVVDEIPGLQYALASPPVTANLRAALTTKDAVECTVLLPNALASLILKLLSWASRHEQKDAVDIWRTLEIARAAGVGPDDWHPSGARKDASAVLRQFAAIGSFGLKQISADRRVQARVRALASAIGPGDSRTAVT